MTMSNTTCNNSSNRQGTSSLDGVACSKSAEATSKSSISSAPPFLQRFRGLSHDHPQLQEQSTSSCSSCTGTSAVTLTHNNSDAEEDMPAASRSSSGSSSCIRDTTLTRNSPCSLGEACVLRRRNDHHEGEEVQVGRVLSWPDDNNNENKNCEGMFDTHAVKTSTDFGNNATDADIDDVRDVHCVDCAGCISCCTCPHHHHLTTTPTKLYDPNLMGVIQLPPQLHKALFFWKSETMSESNSSNSAPEEQQDDHNNIVHARSFTRKDSDDGSFSNNNHCCTANNNNNTKKKRPRASFAQQWANCVHVVRDWIVAILQLATRYAALYPWTTIVITVVVSFTMLAAGYFTNFYLELANENLWPPRNSLSYQHSSWFYLRSSFNYDTSYFKMIVHADGQDVLTGQGVERTFEALDAIRMIDGYMEGCAWADVFGDEYYIGKCKIHSIAQFWNNNVRDYYRQTDHGNNGTAIVRQVSQPYYPNGMYVDVPTVMGHAEWTGTANNDTRLLASAQALLITFDLPWTNVTEDFEWTAMERIHQLQAVWDADPNNAFHVEMAAYRSYSDEFFRAIMMDLPLLPACFFVMSLFCCFVFWKRDRVQSRCLLGVGAVVCILLSITTGYGLLFCIGVPFTPVTSMLPFLMFGIGLDDSFIIYGSYNRLDPRIDTLKRLQITMDEVGLSISLTSITSAVAFITGVFSNIPAVRWVCLYAFPTIIIDFVYQVTFFIALIALDDRRINANRKDICVWSSAPSPEPSDPTLESSDETNSAVVDGVSSPTSAAGSSNSSVVKGLEEDAEQPPIDPNPIPKSIKKSQAQCDEQLAHPADRFMHWFGKQLLRKWVQALVIACFLALNACSILSATQLKQQFNYLGLVPEHSYLKDYYAALNTYTTRHGLYTYVFFRDVDQSDSDIQDQMLAYVDDLYVSGVISSPPVYFWLRDFRGFLADPENADVAIKPFSEQIKAFFADPGWKDLYGEHVVVNDDGSVDQSRCVAYIDVDLESSRAGTYVLERLRGVSSRQPINQDRDDWAFFTYADEYHIWEFYSVVVKELISNTIMSVTAVIIIALIFIPHWTAVLFVGPFISFLYIDMLGFLNISGVEINAISYILLVMSVGLMVDFIIHVLLRYYESKGTREQRVVETLSTMGASILVGGISTFLGVLLLWFSTSEIINNIFVSFIGLITFGVVHGLVFLPVVLAMVGPEF